MDLANKTERKILSFEEMLSTFKILPKYKKIGKKKNFF